MQFEDTLRTRLADNLSRHERLAMAHEGLRRAAVAVVVVDSDPVLHGEDTGWPGSDRALAIARQMIPGADSYPLTGSVAGTAGGAAVLLTRRAASLRAHGAQWALPGGRIDPGEQPIDTALRELCEELSLQLSPGDCLGLLDDYTTRSGYVITPLVFWGGGDPQMKPNPEEVLSVHRVSLRELCRADSPRFVQIPESSRPVVQIPIGGDLIHAPTGAVLLQFRRVAIEGTCERVLGYEQPVFAWR